MPIKLSNIAANTATARVDYGADGDINIVWRPNALTEKTMARMHILADKANLDIEANAHALNAMLRQLILSWDILGDDGEPIPLTEDALGDIPISVRGDVLKAIMEQMTLGEGSGTTLKARSRATSSTGKRAGSHR